jgi:hypothetical protein
MYTAILAVIRPTAKLANPEFSPQRAQRHRDGWERRGFSDLGSEPIYFRSHCALCALRGEILSPLAEWFSTLGEALAQPLVDAEAWGQCHGLDHGIQAALHFFGRIEKGCAFQHEAQAILIAAQFVDGAQVVEHAQDDLAA